MSLSPGQSVAGYQILRSLGVGGMGEVYRARDTSLGREVAIKVLPPDWEEDETHASRFEREARTLASLNHPNVAQVYAFEEVDGVRLLVLELVEGEDLADRIARGPLPVRETVELCTQIAKGLEAAHDLGVVHRDLKPANVRVTPGDRIKVLDFGLAKSTRALYDSAEAPTRARGSSFETQDGTLLGTPAYMSPEQVRARRVDRRTDIWAFGCVLYECLTGAAPFTGESLADTLAAIVKEEPDLAKLPADTPPYLRTLIARCLDKDSRTRLRDIGEARIVLEGGLPTQASPAAGAAVSGGWWRVAALTLLIVSAALATRALMSGTDASGDFASRWERATFHQVTDFPGAEWDAAISRDGKTVAFVSDRGGSQDIWLTHPSTGALENLTQGRRTIWFPRVRNLGFDPDGTRVWLGAPGGDERIGAIPLIGGDWQAIFAKGAVNVDWSPDGTQVVYHVLESGDPLWIADADGGNARHLITHDPGLHQHFEAWSLDGRWIFMSRGLPTTLEMNLWRVGVDGEGLEQLTWEKKDLAYPVQIDEQTVLYVARELNGDGPWLWEVDLDTKESRRVDKGLSHFLSLGASDDRRRLVVTVARPRAHLWRVAIPEEGAAGEEDAERVAGLEIVQAEAPRFGGDRLFFVSRSGRGDGITCVDGSQPTEVLRRDDSPLLFSPAVSPDGATLAVALPRGDAMRLCVVDVAGSMPRIVSTDVSVGGAAAWSPDGEWIAIGGEDDDGPGLFLLQPDGSETQRVVHGPALNPTWSPDGDVIVYCGPQIGWWLPLLGVRIADGTSMDLGSAKVIREGERVRFHPDGRSIVYMHGRRTGQDFRRLYLDTKEDRLLASFDDRAEMRTFDIDPTGSYIVFDRLERNSDIVLIELADRGK